LGRLAIWTGIPSHGKSSVVDWINVLLNTQYQWKSAYFSPESFPTKYHFARIYSLLTGKQFRQSEDKLREFEKMFEYIEDNFFFIYPEDNFKIENILEKATYLVRKRGVNILTIDPYNTLENTRNKSESDTDYVNRVLDALDRFKKKNNCLVNLVAHPTKMKKDITGAYERPTMYDISGSANFYNRADYGISIYRYFGEDPRMEMNVLKVKWKHLGEGGSGQFIYNKNNGRLETEKNEAYWNNDNYLTKKETPVQQSFYDVDKDDDFFNNIEPNTQFDNETPF
jgi:twinkle protein